MKTSALLVGDSIENPGNALTMLHAAEMYGTECRFYDSSPLEDIEVLSEADLTGLPGKLVAFDNLPGAREIYGYSGGKKSIIAVGNERRGLSRSLRDLSKDAVEIPMHSRKINCLNVAASAAVALHYMTRAKVGPIAQRKKVDSYRPELLLMGAGNHIELGSAIRSATAFGWDRAFVEDRQALWFGCDRVIRSEGRGAARRGRNKIRLVPCRADADYHFQEVVVVTARASHEANVVTGPPIHRAKLAKGQKQLIVIPDEEHVDLDQEDWQRLGRNVQWISLSVPAASFTYHYRLIATVAMAEVARQVGRRLPGVPKPRRRAPVYDRSLQMAAETEGEDVWLQDLLDY